MKRKLMFIFSKKGAAQIREQEMKDSGYTNVELEEINILKLKTVGIPTAQTTTIWNDGKDTWLVSGTKQT